MRFFKFSAINYTLACSQPLRKNNRITLTSFGSIILLQRRKEGIFLEPKGKFFKGYNVSADAQCTNAFSTAAFRMGHSMIRDTFVLLGTNFARSQFDQPNELQTKDFFNPYRFYQAGDNAYGGILLGLFRTFARNVDR